MRLQRRLLAGGTIIAGAVVGSHALPNGYAWGCLNISKSLPFCDHALPMEVRTQDLVSRLTLREKISLLGADTKNTNVGSCDCMDYGVERLGIPKYMNLVSHSEIRGSPNRILGGDPSYSPWPRRSLRRATLLLRLPSPRVSLPHCRRVCAHRWRPTPPWRRPAWRRTSAAPASRGPRGWHPASTAPGGGPKVGIGGWRAWSA